MKHNAFLSHAFRALLVARTTTGIRIAAGMIGLDGVSAQDAVGYDRRDL